MVKIKEERKRETLESAPIGAMAYSTHFPTYTHLSLSIAWFICGKEEGKDVLVYTGSDGRKIESWKAPLLFFSVLLYSGHF